MAFCMAKEKDTMNPIEQAIAPLKNEAIARGEKDAREYIEQIRADLEAHGWDLDKAAPMPKAWGASREAYRKAMRKRDLYRTLVRSTDNNCTRRPNDPYIVRIAEPLEARFIENARTLAGQQYETFVAKMIAKIGPCKSATLTGSHIWGFSILHIETHNGHQEKWKTQQIVNKSKLGTLFNQWPSRLIK